MMLCNLGGLWTDGRTIWHRRGDSGVIAVYTWWPATNTTLLLKDGMTGKLTVRRKYNNPAIIFQLDMTEDGGFVFQPELTAGIEPHKYHYDVELTLGDGTVKTIAMGRYILLPDVTY